MRMYDLIEKKKIGKELTENEIRWLISEYVAGEIPDYQMAAMLMALYLKGMSDQETFIMTDVVAHSGDMVDLAPISGIKVDKHSTGGVGDKTTLVIAPIVAACGVNVAKMSGRGLGHTGGTVDKLESIPGFRTEMGQEEFFEAVKKSGICVIGQSGNLTPADKKMYALRDVTATVDNIGLIAVSIMGKKLAAGNDAIVLDVTTGSGAFMKSTEDSIELALKMTAIGENAGKKMAALITDMDVPLGNTIGNILEMQEALEVLKGGGPADLQEVCMELAGNMLYLAGLGTLEECKQKARATIQDGSALQKFKDMVEVQGGDPSYADHPEKFTEAPYSQEVLAPVDGYIVHMDTEKCGIASSLLGAGRRTKESTIDLKAGIRLLKKTGDAVKKGEVIAILYASEEKLFDGAAELYLDALTIGNEKPKERPLLLARVEQGNVERFDDNQKRGSKMDPKEMLKYVDHTQLKAYATWEDIKKLCDEAVECETASVCIPPCYIKRVNYMYGDKLNICTVVGFPLGYSVTAAKLAEVQQALADGANEIDMVVNISDVKNGDFEAVEREIAALKAATGDKVLKVIIETCYLTENEKIALCKAVTNAGADFIKTSTGFGTGGATMEDIKLFKEHIGEKVKMKAAGGVKSVEDLEAFIKEGCARIGTSSAVKMVKEVLKK